MTQPKKAKDTRWYEDACGTAHALELLGERWAMLIVRELLFGPRRFGEIRAGLPGISANALSQRLEGLGAAGIVQRRQLPSPVNAQVYELTPWGYETRPIFETMGRWAARSPAHDPSLPASAATVMSSFRTMVERTRAEKLDGRVGVRFPNDAFVITLPALDVERENPDGCDVIFTCDPPTLAALVYGRRPFDDAEQKGQLTIEGDRRLAARFVTLFVLPPKA